MGCGFAGLWLVDLLFSCFVGLWFDSFWKNESKIQCLNFVKNHIHKSSKIHPKLVQNPSKIDQKRSQIDENASLERFRRQIAPRSALGRLPDERRVTFFRLFGRKCRSEGRFLGPWKIANRSKIALLSPDGRLDPPKIASGRRFGKT